MLHFEIFGILLMIAIWAMLIAAVAKAAQARGRHIAGWALAGAGAGAFGVLVGLALTSRAIDDDASVSLTMLSTLTPMVLMIFSMAAIAFYLLRSPLEIAATKQWPVHFIPQGAGQVQIAERKARFEWADGSRELALEQLRAEADGECVRVKCGDDEIVVMPMGQPETPEGRRLLSTQLARRLRA